MHDEHTRAFVTVVRPDRVEFTLEQMQRTCTNRELLDFKEFTPTFEHNNISASALKAGLLSIPVEQSMIAQKNGQNQLKYVRPSDKNIKFSRIGSISKRHPSAADELRRQENVIMTITVPGSKYVLSIMPIRYANMYVVAFSVRGRKGFHKTYVGGSLAELYQKYLYKEVSPSFTVEERKKLFSSSVYDFSDVHEHIYFTSKSPYEYCKKLESEGKIIDFFTFMAKMFETRNAINNMNFAVETTTGFITDLLRIDTSDGNRIAIIPIRKIREYLMVFYGSEENFEKDPQLAQKLTALGFSEATSGWTFDY